MPDGLTPDGPTPGAVDAGSWIFRSKREASESPEGKPRGARSSIEPLSIPGTTGKLASGILNSGVLSSGVFSEGGLELRQELPAWFPKD
jgi:hypothetical protein